MTNHFDHEHEMKMYGVIKLYAGSGSPVLAQKIADYLQQKLSPRDIIQFPNENIFIKLNSGARGQCASVITDDILPGALQPDGVADHDPDHPAGFCGTHYRGCPLPVLRPIG